MRRLKLILVLAIFVGGLTISCKKENRGKDSVENSSIIENQEDPTESDSSISKLKRENADAVSTVGGEGVLDHIVINEKPTVIDFNATWCVPCEIMKPIFEKMAVEFGDEYNFVSIDVDENPELAKKYGIQNIPAFIFLDEDGEEVDRTIGAMSEEEFHNLLLNPNF